MFPYRIVFGKVCHLPIEMEYCAYWEARKESFNYKNLRSFTWRPMRTPKFTRKRNEATNKTFKVNGHQLKLFHECPTMMEGDVEDLSLVKPTLSKMQIIAP
ncbi:hypothetical protein CR513_50476, partial [Mucuna pruriens]